MWNTGLDEAQAGLKIVGRNVNNLRYADDTTLMVEREEELKSLLMKVKEESEKADLKFSIQKRKIMASGPIPSWKIDRETKEIMSLQTVTAATKWKDASAPWKKNYDQPRQLIKKQRHYFAKKVHLVKAIIFPVVMYGCESWTIKKVERRRIDAFELWCWRRLVRVPWTAKRSNQSIKGNQSWMFTGRTDVEAEAAMLWPPVVKSWINRKDPDAGKDWRPEEKGMTEDEMVGWLTDSLDMSLSKLWQMVKDRGAWHAAVHGVAKSRTWLSNWTTYLASNLQCLREYSSKSKFFMNIWGMSKQSEWTNYNRSLLNKHVQHLPYVWPILGILWIWTQLILIVIPCSRHCFCPHFSVEEIEWKEVK